MPDNFHTEALDELHQIRNDILESRRTLLKIVLTDGTGDTESALARMWLLGTVESALWRIESRLKEGSSSEP